MFVNITLQIYKYIIFLINDNEYIEYLINLILILLVVSMLVLCERKILGSIQKRKGPNFIGFFGLLQPIADAIKLLIKEIIIPRNTEKFIFIFSPILCTLLSLIIWNWFPSGASFSIYSNFYIIKNGDYELSLLWWIGTNAINIFSLLLAGWSSNNAYAFLASLRVVSQMLAYESFFVLSILPLVLNEETFSFLNFSQKQTWDNNISYLFLFVFNFIIFFISALAETNRTPFDHTEAEGEIVAGYNIEYGGAIFLLFYLAEYINILSTSFTIVYLFLNNNFILFLIIDCFFFYTFYYFLLFFFQWSGLLKTLYFKKKLNFLFNFIYTSKIFVFNYKNIIYLINLIIIIFIIIWIRATLPRFRYDQLINVAWQHLMPFSFFLYLYILLLIYFIDIF